LKRADSQGPEERLAVAAGAFIGLTIGSVLVIVLAFAADQYGWTGTGANLAVFAIFFAVLSLCVIWRTRRVRQGKRSARLSREEFAALQATWLVLIFCAQVWAQWLLYQGHAAPDGEMFALDVAFTSAAMVPAYLALLRKPMPVALPVFAVVPVALAVSGLAWLLAYALATHLS